MTLATFPPRRSAGSAPLRAPGSVRRTSSIDVDWPDGREGRMRFRGQARDLATPRGGGAAVVVGEGGFEALVTPGRRIESLNVTPPRPALAALVGQRAGGGLRRALGEAVPEERRLGTPLYLLLDDLAAASLIAGAAWPQWDKDVGAPPMSAEQMEQILTHLIDVCIGHGPGSSANDLEGVDRDYGEASAADLVRADDPAGWHELAARSGPGLRRARRIDVRCEAQIVIDAEFQDSALRPGGGRAAVHEYGLRATADPVSLRILSIEAEPRVLPYPECPAAAAGLSRLVGAPLAELRERVLVEFAGVAGCTHLNDAVRALAEVPALLEHAR
jgi:hypothetical protein